MQTVNFIRMADGTKEEYDLLEEAEKAYCESLPDRLMTAMQQLENSFSGYRVSRLEHSLQSATRALEAGEDEEMIVAALLHDIGDPLAPAAHSEFAAAILRPYVSERVYWIIKHHGLFQTYYYAQHRGQDPNMRDVFKGHKWYQDCVDFCADFDQNCFDPEYPAKSLEFFRPMVERVFTVQKNFNF